MHYKGKSTYLKRLFSGLNELMNLKHLVQSLSISRTSFFVAVNTSRPRHVPAKSASKNNEESFISHENCLVTCELIDKKGRGKEGRETREREKNPGTGGTMTLISCFTFLGHTDYCLPASTGEYGLCL